MMRGRSLPLLLVGAALVVQLFPALGAELIFDRAAIGAGEYWRIVSGNLVHFSWLHLAGDAVVLLVAGWLMEVRPAERLVLLIGAMAASGFAVLLFAPELRWFGGLSGVGYAALVYGALSASRDRGGRRLLSLTVLAVVAIWLALDAQAIRHLSGSHDGRPVVVAVVSHLGAVGYAVALFAVVSRAAWRGDELTLEGRRNYCGSGRGTNGDEERTATRNVEGSDCRTRDEEIGPASHRRGTWDDEVVARPSLLV